MGLNLKLPDAAGTSGAGADEKPATGVPTTPPAGQDVNTGGTPPAGTPLVTGGTPPVPPAGNPPDDVAQVEIDGVLYNIDTTGNVVDKEGKVFKTKDELDTIIKANSSQAPPADEDLVKTLIAATNIVITDDKGTPIEYESTHEGVTKYIADVYNKGAVDRSSAIINEWASRFPVLPDVIRHLELNDGKLEGFSNKPSYKSVKLDEGNVNQLKTIITEARIARGEDPDSVSYFITAVEKDNKLVDFAKAELNYLQKSETARIAAEEQKLAFKQQQEELDEKKYWDSVVSTINQGKIKVDSETYTIPDVIRVKTDKGTYVNASKQDFIKYIYNEVPYNINGQVTYMTKYEYDKMKVQSKITVQDEVWDAYKQFVGGDTSQFIKAQIKQEQINQIRKLTTKNLTNNAASGNPPTDIKTLDGKKLVLKGYNTNN